MLPMQNKPPLEAFAIREFIALIKKLIETVPLPLNQRPAYPSITSPSSGSVITASQATPVSLTVTVSSNRPDEPHVVELLNDDTFAVLDSQPVNFGTNSAQVMIPAVNGTTATTMLLQCRAPGDAAGNVHRILFNAQAPALPQTPTVAVNATTSSGLALPSGMYNHTTTPGLNAVTFAATASGTAPFTFNWIVTISTTSTPNTTQGPTFGPVNLIPSGTTFPTAAAVSVFVTDANGLNSAPAQLNYFFG
jgi:hypothetical protein